MSRQEEGAAGAAPTPSWGLSLAEDRHSKSPQWQGEEASSFPSKDPSDIPAPDPSRSKRVAEKTRLSAAALFLGGKRIQNSPSHPSFSLSDAKLTEHPLDLSPELA